MTHLTISGNASSTIPFDELPEPHQIPVQGVHVVPSWLDGERSAMIYIDGDHVTTIRGSANLRMLATKFHAAAGTLLGDGGC